jgi:hypothetical protein
VPESAPLLGLELVQETAPELEQQQAPSRELVWVQGTVQQQHLAGMERFLEFHFHYNR